MNKQTAINMLIGFVADIESGKIALDSGIDPDSINAPNELDEFCAYIESVKAAAYTLREEMRE